MGEIWEKILVGFSQEPGRPPRSRLLRAPAWLSPKVFRTEALGGLVVALALIPEAISFSIIAGVDPATPSASSSARSPRWSSSPSASRS
ncbi:hypothetical protein M8Z33_14670 [Streptomyces sp. ZAF1911]|uniref:hypothetical protein n=1 Tax=Streptomyces sp. ZAF1911 TaxID=2944129 RepID=UPI00237AEA42|nr:hypothetical protein [Streptomyces sp. ZAF1911]MDD9377881.1 hypothetical protein [Streptomyces sp. ZAF1911]